MAAGNLYFPNDSVQVDRSDGTNWSSWGPIYPFTTPPVDVSTQATTLSGNGGSITAIATSMLVASSSGFPAVPFLCKIGTEDIKVTAVASLTWTIVRAYNGTTGATHNDGDAVTQLNWEWVNQNGASTAQLTNSGICLSSPGRVGLNMSIRKRLIGSNTSLRVAFSYIAVGLASAYSACGIVFRESATGKIANFELRNQSTLCFFAQHWANATTATATDLEMDFGRINFPVFLRADISGANLVYYVSQDGQNWFQYLSVAKTTQFTTGPDEWGFMVWTNSTSTQALIQAMTLHSWKEQ